MSDLLIEVRDAQGGKEPAMSTASKGQRKARVSEYERGFMDGVNCKCAICAKRRGRLRRASREFVRREASQSQKGK